MSACTDVKDWVTENVTIPVERWVERAEEKCEQARRWVEREVREPIERRRERQEKKCKKRKCKWYCACCNKWFCWLETIIETFIEWVVKVVGEWLVETVCKIVVRLVKIIVRVVVAVAKFVVVGVVCIFTDWRGLLDLLIDTWFEIVDIFKDVLDLVNLILEQLVDLIDLTIASLEQLAGQLGWLGFILGLLIGILSGIRRIIDGIRQIFEGLANAIINFLKLDFCGFLEDLVYGLSGLGGVITGAFGVATVGSSGAAQWVRYREKRDAIASVLDENFNDNVAENIKDGINLETSSLGLPWKIRPIRTQVRSVGERLTLKMLHESDQLNLYGALGYGPTCKRKFFNHGRLDVVYEGTNRKVDYSHIRRYLAGETVPNFVCISVRRDVFLRQMEATQTKALQLGLKFHWDEFELLTVNHIDRFILPDLRDDTAKDMVEFATGNNADNPPTAYCTLPIICVFGYAGGNFGYAEADWISAGNDQRIAIGATYRDFRPDLVFQTVPVHEAGHCFDLKHDGHDGAHNIMYTAADSAGLDAVTLATVAEYLALGGEPRFTTGDVSVAWNWIVNKARSCLPLEGPIVD
ncbi:MAG: hypothetical protein ACRBHB_04290 [Arenicella sp.]